MLARPLGSAWDVNFIMSYEGLHRLIHRDFPLQCSKCVSATWGGTSKKCRMSPAVPVRVNVSVVLTIFWYGDASVEKVNVLQRRVPKNWGQLTTWPPNGKIFPSLDFFFSYSKMTMSGVSCIKLWKSGSVQTLTPVRTCGMCGEYFPKWSISYIISTRP